MHERLSEKKDLENKIIIETSFFLGKYVQGPKGERAQICEVHLQYGNSTTKWPFYTIQGTYRGKTEN